MYDMRNLRTCFWKKIFIFNCEDKTIGNSSVRNKELHFGFETDL